MAGVIPHTGSKSVIDYGGIDRPGKGYLPIVSDKTCESCDCRLWSASVAWDLQTHTSIYIYPSDIIG